jgi:hypothetical protein
MKHPNAMTAPPLWDKDDGDVYRWTTPEHDALQVLPMRGATTPDRVRLRLGDHARPEGVDRAALQAQARHESSDPRLARRHCRMTLAPSLAPQRADGFSPVTVTRRV